MIYPSNFENKIGFTEIRQLLKERCLSTMGKERVDAMKHTFDARAIRMWLAQVKEFRQILASEEEFPTQYYFDVREGMARLRLEGTHLEASELFDLRRLLDTVSKIVKFLSKKKGGNDSDGERDNDELLYPTLKNLISGIRPLVPLVTSIDKVLDKYGRIRDNASPTLFDIRQQLSRTEGSISRILNSILKSAQSEGLVEKDATPTIRDGRLVIPVAPAMKRRIRGIVHDESATGKTVFIEPAEVVEANNLIRELEAEEKREIIRILNNLANEIRPHVQEILDSTRLIGTIDLIRAKALFADMLGAVEPTVDDKPRIDWRQARHPLLQLSLSRQDKKIVPLDITLTIENRILVISGPNAGGKSVCLKTVGLLQYMLQCGLPILVGDRSEAGVFRNIMIDIGDEQSIEDDLSTYSSHLLNMKNMMRLSNNSTLLLIDEFGSGTEPQIGGAIAEAVLKQFWEQKAWGVITTHYQNLKHFADSHDGVVNGAMLYDRHEMKALFQLEIGRPGSSFAIEIARKTGIPEVVISDATEIVGSDFIQSDKYLQDIMRDKRYWEGKRQSIHQREKSMEETIARYEEELAKLKESRKEILSKAREEAEHLLQESNRMIEKTIRDIKEKQAEREETKRLREDLNQFRQEVLEIDTKADEELMSRKIQQIRERQQRKEKRRKEKEEKEAANAREKKERLAAEAQKEEPLKAGDSVRIKGLTTVGTIEKADGKMATVVFGGMRTIMRADRLERAEKPEIPDRAVVNVSATTRETIDNRREQFHQDIDVRGMRGDEALNAVTYFIDDAILVGMSRVRILHGTGSGILRQLIRQYLNTVPAVTAYRDEHVQFGGAGITVVDLE